MVRARRHLIEHDIVTVPDDERIVVIPTPEYIRNVIPFAAYFDPPKFDANPNGIYIVTPSVGDDPRAMREHNYSSISNTSIHEAYPGHHLQLSVAGKHPSLTRALTNAPEFVEGWGMYSEQLMREQGFDDAPNFRLNMHTDAIWRACRIILDVRMHRGEIGVDDAITVHGRADELRGVQRPGRGPPLHLHPDLPAELPAGQGPPAPAPGRRGGAARAARSRSSASTTRSSERQPADQLPPPAARGRRRRERHRRRVGRRPRGRALTRRPVQIIPAIDLEGGRSRVVSWPGASAGVGAPTDRPERIAARFVEQGARLVHLVDFDGARAGARGTSRRSARVAARVAVPLQVAGGLESADAIRLAFAAGATRVVARPDRRRGPDRSCEPASRSPATGWRSASIRGPTGWPPSRGAGPAVPTIESLVGELVDAGVRRLVLGHGGGRRTSRLLARLVASYDAEVLVAGGAADPTAISRIRDAGVAGLILGESLLSGAIDFPAALEAAA